MIVYDNSLDHQYTTIRKFAKRWFGPYEVRKVFDNGMYRLCELDGTMLRVPIAGKRVKIFKKRMDEEPYVILDKTDNEEQSNEDRGDAGSEEGLQLIVDIRGESEEASGEDGYEESRTSAHTGGCAGSEGASVVVYSAHYEKTVK